MSTPAAVTVRTAGSADLPAAAALLAQARLAGLDGQLLGSGTTLTSCPSGESAFAVVLSHMRRRWQVDLATAGGQTVGVACWISHLACPRPCTADQPPIPLFADPVGDLHDRLDLLDLTFAIPADPTHHHLAYLGTRTGRRARHIATSLLHQRGLEADQHHHSLYTEAHGVRVRDRLHKYGYRNPRSLPGRPGRPSLVRDGPHHRRVHRSSPGRSATPSPVAGRDCPPDTSSRTGDLAQPDLPAFAPPCTEPPTSTGVGRDVRKHRYFDPALGVRPRLRGPSARSPTRSSSSGSQRSCVAASSP